MATMFADATAVTPAEQEGDFTARVHEGWDILGNANGGYLLAIAGRALSQATGRPDPVTVTAHFLAPGRPGPATVTTQVSKVGKRFTTAAATLATERPLITVLGTFGELADSEGDEATASRLHVAGSPPDLPDPDDCPSMSGSDSAPEFMHRIDLRLHPEDAGFVVGEPTGTPRVRGWFRLRDGEPVDTIGLLCAVDAFPPTAFNAKLPVAWTPTVELTAHVRARPAVGWLACSFSTRFVTGGFLEADGEVWDSTGALVAQSRQLALVPRT